MNKIYIDHAGVGQTLKARDVEDIIQERDRLKTRLEAAEKRTTNAKRTMGEMQADWELMRSSERMAREVAAREERIRKQVSNQRVRFAERMNAAEERACDAEKDAWKWSECYARLCACSGKTDTRTYRMALAVAEKYAELIKPTVKTGGEGGSNEN